MMIVVAKNPLPLFHVCYYDSRIKMTLLNKLLLPTNPTVNYTLRVYMFAH